MNNLPPTMIQDAYETSYHFQRPTSALYVTSPSWDLSKQDLPYLITEDNYFVFGRNAYIPVPFHDFAITLHTLSTEGAVHIMPSDLKESIDLDPLQDSIANQGIAYLLCGEVIVRLRRDHAPQEQDVLHTLTMLGKKDSLIQLAGKAGLPHPFDASCYPYKGFFYDPRSTLPFLH